MKGRIDKINISQIINYYENPRHAIGSNEKDTIKKLFDAVGVQYMLNLAEDLHENGFLGCQQITLVYSKEIEKYIVYEGNRRVACMKFLKNPEEFDFLDLVTINKAKKIAAKKSEHELEILDCYITDEDEAMFIMERIHSGEDKGRGTKQWTSREKDIFKVRQNHTKSLQYLVDFYTKKYFDELDITNILPFTTIQRIFNNREIKKEIGIDVSDELTFTKERINLILTTARWVREEAEETGEAPTRLFNKAREIEDIVLPFIQAYKENSATSDNHSDEKNDGNTPPDDDNKKHQNEAEPKGNKKDKGAGKGKPKETDTSGKNPNEKHEKILLRSSITVEEGIELYLKREDIINVPADKIQIVKCMQMELRNGDIFKDSNRPGQYIVDYLYETRQERLTINVTRKSAPKAKEDGLFKASNQFIGDINLGDMNGIIQQLYGLDYQKYYLLYIVSFRAIIENMSKEYIIQNNLTLSGQLKDNVKCMVAHLLQKISINGNDPQKQQKTEIHELFKGFQSLKNFLGSVKVKFDSGSYDELLHSMTHNPSIISYSFASEIANEIIVPMHMLIGVIDKKL